MNSSGDWDYARVIMYEEWTNNYYRQCFAWNEL